MKASERERARRDIAEAFDFARCLIKDPRLLRKLKDGSEVRFLPAPAGRSTGMPRAGKRVQAFAAETVYHPL